MGTELFQAGEPGSVKLLGIKEPPDKSERGE